MAGQKRNNLLLANPIDSAQTDRYPHAHEHSTFHAFCSQSSYHHFFHRNHLLHENVFVSADFDPGLVCDFVVEVGVELGVGSGPAGILRNPD